MIFEGNLSILFFVSLVFWYWTCDTQTLRRIVSREQHCIYTNYHLANRWIVLQNYGFDYTVLVMVGKQLTKNDEERHGTQYHTTMGKKKTLCLSYWVKRVAICNTRVKLSPPPKENSVPAPITSSDSVQRLNNALGEAHIHEIKCNLCYPQQESSISQTVGDSTTLQPTKRSMRLMKQQPKKRLAPSPRNPRAKKAKQIVISSDTSDTDSTSSDATSSDSSDAQEETDDDFVVNDNDELSEYSSQDYDAAPKSVVPYDPKKDTIVNVDVDHIRFEDLVAREEFKGYIFYNRHGVMLNGLDFDTLSTSIEFVCLESGEVIYAGQQNLSVFWCMEADDTEVHAVGKCTKLKLEKDMTVNATILWLKTGKEYLLEFKPFENKDKNLCFEKEDVLPLKESFRVQFSHLVRSVQEKLVMDYFTTYQAYNDLDKRDPLRRWSYEKHHQSVANDRQMLDIYDYLELYHIQDKWLWRSAGGKYIWNTFVQPSITFGVAPRLDLVQELMNSEYFDDTTHDRELVSCNACGKQEVVKNYIQLTKNRTYKFGYVCLERAKYLFDIADHIRRFRARPFDCNELPKFIPFLINLQSTFNSKSKHIF